MSKSSLRNGQVKKTEFKIEQIIPLNSAIPNITFLLLNVIILRTIFFIDFIKLGIIFFKAKKIVVVFFIIIKLRPVIMPRSR